MRVVQGVCDTTDLSHTLAIPIVHVVEVCQEGPSGHNSPVAGQHTEGAQVVDAGFLPPEGLDAPEVPDVPQAKYPLDVRGDDLGRAWDHSDAAERVDVALEAENRHPLDIGVPDQGLLLEPGGQQAAVVLRVGQRECALSVAFEGLLRPHRLEVPHDRRAVRGGRRKEVEVLDHEQIVDGVLVLALARLRQAHVGQVPAAQGAVDGPAEQAVGSRGAAEAELDVLRRQTIAQAQARLIPQADAHVGTCCGDLIQPAHVATIHQRTAMPSMTTDLLLHGAAGRVVETEAAGLVGETGHHIHLLEVHELLHGLVVLRGVERRALPVAPDAVDRELVAPGDAVVDQIVRHLVPSDGALPVHVHPSEEVHQSGGAARAPVPVVHASRGAASGVATTAAAVAKADGLLGDLGRAPGGASCHVRGLQAPEHRADELVEVQGSALGEEVLLHAV
mmetsp:Transcript_41764/g.135084  ORF Transcript_41764/g.135084 Transcript_41764/m.135084 type:complete len:447 (-) Transcript_41764:540-1880(-)